MYINQNTYTMKKFNVLMSLMLFAALVITSCEGPAGPQGAVGPAGPQGEQGIQGVQGQPGTATCVVCHDNSQSIAAKSTQWELSKHATGGNYVRNHTDCAVCHTSQGFRERIVNDDKVTAADIQDPNPINCYTCHNIHETHTSADWGFTKTDAVDFWVGGTFDFGKANVCASCHQNREPGVTLNKDATVNDTVTITSPYWGPHYAVQGMFIAGMGGIEYGTGYSNSSHTTLVTDACVTCHMADVAYGSSPMAGGHTMNITFLYHGSTRYNFNGCTACHADTDALLTKVTDTKTAMETAIASLKAKLIARGVLDANDHIVPGRVSTIEAGAVWNYIMLIKDKSFGTHNDAYATTLAANTETAIDAL